MAESLDGGATQYKATQLVSEGLVYSKLYCNIVAGDYRRV